uniref:Uncharacterized protein n=1 Tax=Lepeophtheirus salmonis TaxID=72036 RepID=A0A0K2VAN1_LEPSM
MSCRYLNCVTRPLLRKGTGRKSPKISC